MTLCNACQDSATDPLLFLRGREGRKREESLQVTQAGFELTLMQLGLELEIHLSASATKYLEL